MTLPGETHHVPVRYFSDSGQAYAIMQKRSNALAVQNQILSLLDFPGVPERWILRYIIVQTLYKNELYKREITIGHPGNPLFTGDAHTLTIDGIVWRVTGRKGEYRRGPYTS